MKKIWVRLSLLCLCLLMSPIASALVYSLPGHGSDIVGHIQTIKVPYGSTITTLGQQYQIGYLEFYEANPGINLDYLRGGSSLTLPTQYILPNAPHRGIVINLAELRLYYYPPHRNIVITYPVGVGRKRLGSETPLLQTRVTTKREYPVWRPTEETRQEAIERGFVLPPYVEPGPENPLGDYAMNIGSTSYLIHGTNNPSGVGKRSSGGCIRMYPDDVEELFSLVSIGTTIKIVDQPYKIGWNGNQLYLEAHVPMDEKRGRTNQILAQVVKLVKSEMNKGHVKVNWKKVLQVANQQRGIPTVIGHR